jgi:hypothetical protein
MENTMSEANNRQVGGDHYKTGGLEHWDLFGPEYLMGCATKYVSRWRKKNGVHDLEKALHYTEKLRELAAKGYENSGISMGDVLHSWAKNAGLDWTEQTIIELLLRWNNKQDIDRAIEGIRHLIATEASKTTIQKIADLQERTTIRSEPTITGGSAGGGGGWRFSSGGAGGAGGGAVFKGPEMRGPAIEALRSHASMLTTRFESVDQRTPDDGAQHASVTPWVVTAQWLGLQEISDDLIDHYWTKRAANLYVLEPRVTAHNIPKVLRACYNLTMWGWVMNIQRCPDDARDYFPNLYREKNKMEWESLPDWQTGLYQWNAEANKYELSQPNAAWHVETE